MNEVFKIESVTQLAATVSALIDETDEDITVIAKSKIITTLINMLVADHKCTVFNVSIDYEDDEFYLMSVDDIGNIWCQKATYGDKFISLNDDDVNLVDVNIDKDFFNVNKPTNTMFFLSFVNEKKPVKKQENKKDIVTNVDNNTVHQSWTDGKGSYMSRSFMSSDLDDLKSVIDEWNEFADKFNKH